MAATFRLHLKLHDVTGLTRSLRAFNFKKWLLLFALVTDGGGIKSALEKLLLSDADENKGHRLDLSPDFAFVSRHFAKDCKSICIDFMHSSVHRLLGFIFEHFTFFEQKLLCLLYL